MIMRKEIVEKKERNYGMLTLLLATFMAKADLPEAVGPEINIILDLKSIINLA